MEKNGFLLFYPDPDQTRKWKMENDISRKKEVVCFEKREKADPDQNTMP